MIKSATKMLFVLMLALVVAASLPASTFQFTDTGAGNAYTISGTLTGTSNGNGWFTLTSGSGLYNTDSITLIPGSGSNSAFFWDSRLSPGSDPMLDGAGLLFTYSGGDQLNIWGNGPGSYSTYTQEGGGYVLQDGESSFAITGQSPEPGTLAMLAVGLGLACIGGWRRRKAESKA
jgi:hypothetical protein